MDNLKQDLKKYKEKKYEEQSKLGADKELADAKFNTGSFLETLKGLANKDGSLKGIKSKSPSVYASLLKKAKKEGLSKEEYVKKISGGSLIFQANISHTEESASNALIDFAQNSNGVIFGMGSLKSKERSLETYIRKLAKERKCDPKKIIHDLTHGQVELLYVGNEKMDDDELSQVLKTSATIETSKQGNKTLVIYNLNRKYYKILYGRAERREMSIPEYVSEITNGEVVYKISSKITDEAILKRLNKIAENGIITKIKKEDERLFNLLRQRRKEYNFTTISEYVSSLSDGLIEYVVPQKLTREFVISEIKKAQNNNGIVTTLPKNVKYSAYAMATYDKLKITEWVEKNAGVCYANNFQLFKNREEFLEFLKTYEDENGVLTEIKCDPDLISRIRYYAYSDKTKPNQWLKDNGFSTKEKFSEFIEADYIEEVEKELQRWLKYTHGGNDVTRLCVENPQLYRKVYIIKCCYPEGSLNSMEEAFNLFGLEYHPESFGERKNQITEEQLEKALKIVYSEGVVENLRMHAALSYAVQKFAQKYGISNKEMIEKFGLEYPGGSNEEPKKLSKMKKPEESLDDGINNITKSNKRKK